MFSRSGLEASGAVAMVTGVKSGLVVVLISLFFLGAAISTAFISPGCDVRNQDDSRKLE